MMLNNKGIQVVETPDYIKFDNEYKGIIDEENFTNYLMENYADNRENIEYIVEKDVKSIAAIGRIRKDNKYSKLEECKAVFVTTNYNLVEYTERFLEQKRYEEIGFLITDIELITVLWLKSFKSNPDLPKMKLIENARASLELTTTMMRRVKDVLEKMEHEGIINQADIVSSNIQELNYYKKEIMERIDGDEENINEETILGIIDEENIKLKQEIVVEKELNKKIIEENEKAKKEKSDMKESIDKKCREKAKKIVTNLKKTYKILNYSILSIVLIIIIYIIIKNEWSTQNTIYIVVAMLIEILGVIDCFVPKFGKIKNLILTKINDFEEPLYLHYKEKKKDEFPNLF